MATDTDATDPSTTGDPSMVHRVAARNHHQDSTNPIHGDEVATAYGFRGGLVPGVDVFAYATHLPAQVWGVDWLRGGAMSASFRSPVYDGDDVTVEGTRHGEDEIAVTVRNGAGDPCATAIATRSHGLADRPAIDDWASAPAPQARPPASADALAPGTVLGTFGFGFHADRAGEHLDQVAETLPLYRDLGIAHPGWLLQCANTALAQQVVLGPWIHVSSDVTFFDTVGDGQRVEVRGAVTDEHERKGHRFVVLDVAIAADGEVALRITHTAIHTLRGPAGAPA